MGDVDRRSFLAWLGTGVLGATLLSAGRAEAAGTITVLTHATLVDGTDAPPLRDATIVLAGDRIAAVGRGVPAPALAGVRVIDLTGKHVIPGLWDAHTHETSMARTFPALHLVNGVTSIRDMDGSPATHDVLRRVERGELPGPRMVIASRILDGGGSFVGAHRLVATPADAAVAVREEKAGGAGLVKVYSFMSPEIHGAIAAESRRNGLPYGGHIPIQLSVPDVLARGQHTVEHLYAFHASTSTKKAEYYAQLAALPADTGSWPGALAAMDRDAVTSHSAALTRELAGRFRARGAWHVPTLAVLARTSTPPGDLPADPVLQGLADRYLPRAVRQEWLDLAAAWPVWSPERVAQEAAYLEAELELVGELAAAGAPIVAGTDSGYLYTFPGFATHDELELLVRAGLSPKRALQAATRDAARAAGRPSSGTVEVGKDADLVVLDADPLSAITNSRGIHAVVSRGTFLGPAERQRIFADVERAAQEDVVTRAGRSSCCLPH
ncbi:amidohydrolase family protein [Amycolatopsis sp. NPDC049252]|uniref:amidohydrolase family protein n=1 Tax=Amycolatopsis sp. NPDC049252 TaxID=3363933 RepID=UPI00371954C2